MLKDGSKRHNLELSLWRVTPTQLGIFDKNILCDRCDGLLGRLDDYLYDVIRQFDLSKCPRIEDIFVEQTVDCEQFCKGVLAILWRASISNRYPYSKVSLGRYELIVRDILFGFLPLITFTELEILIQYYRSRHIGEKVRFFDTLPQHNKFGELDGYSFGLNGFRISIKIDERNFGADFAPFILNRQKVFRGLVVELEETPEFRRMADIVVADLIRRSARPQTRRRRKRLR